MKQVSAMQCSYCDKIGNEQTISSHEKRCEKRALAEKERLAQLQLRKAKFATLREQAESVSHFAQLITDVLTNDYKLPITCEMSRVAAYAEKDNNYSCPIGGEVNYNRVSTKPLYYPALEAICTFKTISPSTNMDEITPKDIPGLNIETYSYFSTNRKYSATLWINDFPKFRDKAMHGFAMQARDKEWSADQRRRSSQLRNLVDSALNTDIMLKSLNDQVIKRRKDIAAQVTASNKDLAPIAYPLDVDTTSIWNSIYG